MSEEKKKKKPVYLLQGILRCSICEKAFSPLPRTKRYYRCKCLKNIEAGKIEKIIFEEYIKAMKSISICHGGIVFGNEGSPLKRYRAELESCRKKRDDFWMTHYKEEDRKLFLSLCEEVKKLRDQVKVLEDENMKKQNGLFDRTNNTQSEEYYRSLSSNKLKRLYKKQIRIELNSKENTGILYISFLIHQFEPIHFSF